MVRLAMPLVLVSVVLAGCSCSDDKPHQGDPDGGGAGAAGAAGDGGSSGASGTGGTAGTAGAGGTAGDAGTGGTAGAGGDAGAAGMAGMNALDAGTDADMVEDEDAGYDAGPGPRNACGGEACDILDSMSCGAGDNCQFLLPSDPEIVIPEAMCVAAGTQQEGESCTTYDDCAPGLDCSADGTAGVCRQYCCNVNQKSGCPGEQSCVIELIDGNGDSTGVGLCNECDACNPLDSVATCGASVGCYPIPGNDGRTFSDCTLCLGSTQNLAVGERCRSVNDCAPGLGCFRLNNRAPVCVAMCDLQAVSDPCPGSATCQNRLGLASLGDTVGVCVP